jgi:tetratricopeptide (TPR) repeat protein
LEDVVALGLTGEARRDWAVPVAGRWAAPPPTENPLRFAMKAFDAGLTAEAEDYLVRFVALRAGSEPRLPLEDAHFAIARFRQARGDAAGQVAALDEAVRCNPRYRKAHLLLGDLLMGRREYEAASRHLAAAAAIGAPDPDALNRLALAKLATGQLRDAEVHSRDALKAAPGDASAHYNLAFSLQRQGRWQEAASEYGRTLASDASRTMAANNLAWLLATAPDDAVRDGEQAMRIAAQLAGRAGDSQPVFWMTLGAAFAEAGRLEDAVGAATKALQALESSGVRSPLADRLRQQIEGYRAGRPWRDASG